jgi:hypothetical protein
MDNIFVRAVAQPPDTSLPQRLCQSPKPGTASAASFCNEERSTRAGLSHAASGLRSGMPVDDRLPFGFPHPHHTTANRELILTLGR